MMLTPGFEQFWYFLRRIEPTDTYVLVIKLPPFHSAKLWMTVSTTNTPRFIHRGWASNLCDTVPSCKLVSQFYLHMLSVCPGASGWASPEQLLFQGKAPLVIIMQSWVHMVRLVLSNYVHWCWKTFKPRKRLKGVWALVAAKQAGFYTMATGELCKGQMVCHNICSLRGQREDILHVESLGQKTPPRESHEKYKGIKAES